MTISTQTQQERPCENGGRDGVTSQGTPRTPATGSRTWKSFPSEPRRTALPAPHRSLRPPELRANTALLFRQPGGGPLSQLPKQRSTGCGHITLQNAVHMTSAQGGMLEMGGGRMERGTGLLSRVGGRASGDGGAVRVVL